MKYLVSFLTTCISLFFVAQDFEVAPVILNFDANPGEIQQKKVTIRNHANTAQAFTFVIGDYQITKKEILM